ncbi:MAG: CHAT domain-containing protein [Desulfovibrionaceae bacterium]
MRHVLLIVLLLVGCVTTKISTDQYMAQMGSDEIKAHVVKLVANGNYKEAVDLIEDVLGSMPNDTCEKYELLDILADIYTFRLVDFDKALTCNDILGRAGENGVKLEVTLRNKIVLRYITIYDNLNDANQLSKYAHTDVYAAYMRAQEGGLGALSVQLSCQSNIESSICLSSCLSALCRNSNIDAIQFFESFLKALSHEEDTARKKYLLRAYYGNKRASHNEEDLFFLKQYAQSLTILSLPAALIVPVSPLVINAFATDTSLDMVNMHDAMSKTFFRSMLLADETKMSKTLNRHLSGYQQLELLLRMAQAYRDQGDKDKAILYAKEVISLINRQRSTASSEENRIFFMGDKGRVYALLISLLAEAKRDAEVFEYIDKYKSRTLVDYIYSSNIVFAGNDAHQDIYKSLQREQMMDSFLLSSAAISDSQVRGLGTMVSPPVKIVESLPLSLKILHSAKVASIQELQSLVLPDVSIVNYFVANDGVYISVLDRDHVTVRKTIVSMEELANLINEYNVLIHARKVMTEGRTISRELYDKLVGPVDNVLRKHVIIIPHGILHNVSFASLMSKDGFFINEHDQVYSYSANLWAMQHAENETIEKSALLNPITPLNSAFPQIPYATKEVKDIYAILGSKDNLLSNDCTQEGFLAALQQYDLVHFAGHAVYENSHPLDSYILLSDNGRDVKLMAKTLMGQSANRAKLVVLSACQTALGATAPGDEQIGLVRSFILSGAKAVVSTQWEVSDESTYDVMTSMYRNFKQSISSAAALNQAQREMIPVFQEPFFWAAFKYYGVDRLTLE